MGTNYVEPRRARHRVETVDGVEQLRIPIRRNWFAILFLPAWLVGWGFGEVSAIGQLAQGLDTFLAAWLVGWTVGGAFAAWMLLSQLFGAEIVRVVGGDLEVRLGAWRLRRTWRYRGGEIENLMAWSPDTSPFWMSGYQHRFSMRPQSGAVKFDYGAESVFLATGVDEPEGREIVAWLGKRLPRGAMGE
jgi:hypothetical protein